MDAVEVQSGLWSMISSAGPVVKLVMLVLLGMSVFSWAIIFYKVNLIRKIERETSAFYDLFWTKSDMAHVLRATGSYALTPLSRLFKEAYSISEKGRQGSREGYVNRALKKIRDLDKAAMEKSTAFLATTGNTAPFIGLFGTVWGIMNTFGSIGVSGSANIAVVAPGIAEALVATAMGLFAAIPAVIGYNYLLTRIDAVSNDMDAFSADLINLVEEGTLHAPENTTPENIKIEEE